MRTLRCEAPSKRILSFGKAKKNAMDTRRNRIGSKGKGAAITGLITFAILVKESSWHIGPRISPPYEEKTSVHAEKNGKRKSEAIATIIAIATLLPPFETCAMSPPLSNM